MPRQLLRYQDGLWPHGLAMSYGSFGYSGGLVLITLPSSLANSAGVLFLAHGLAICAYLIHECAHSTIFTAQAHNARLGACLGWITGSCYSRYADLRHKHFRHHVERADVIAFDYRRRLTRHRRLVKLVAALEWCYVPAVEILLHALVILLPFMEEYYKPRRGRVLIVMAVRAALFTLLGMVSIRALPLYAAAYMLFLTVLRFMDANQHSYELVEARDAAPLPGAERRDREYEYRNTYSNLLSVRYPALNMLTLNFAYHNAHHDRPTVPWYRLPALHDSLCGGDRSHVLPFRDLIASFHRCRVARAFRPNAAEPHSHPDNGPDLPGIDGVSFLVPV